jgi:N-acetylgalactosamine-N,N'-diacetylbacillosaminyl-diphospho-undecaprenol 4-alpha-N-acetylgalactosaminyltransferase
MRAMTNGLNTIITDKALFEKCKENALKSVQKFSLEIIGNQWLDLMAVKK